MFWDSRIDSEFRKVWQILNRFCCKVKSCLGISSQGNPDLVLNQQGNWIETQSSSYKVYTALLTQSGDEETANLSSGDLTVGVTYYIDDNPNGADFTNVGAPNNENGTFFLATGTTPNSWGEFTNLQYTVGAPVVTVLENTLGGIYWTYDGSGIYYANLTGGFIIGKTWMVADTLQNTGAYTQNYKTLDVIELYTFNNANIQVDGLLNNTGIEIRVYN
jgi:hypothetical protein